MNGRIGQLRSHYRIFGARATAPALASRLDHAFVDFGLKQYEKALSETLDDDEKVYILRHVTAGMTLVIGDGQTDTTLAKSWGTKLANAVVRQIAEAEGDPGNLVRFENRADYVAHFVVALLKGPPAKQWFFKAFADYASGERAQSIQRVLLDNKQDLAAILAYLHRYNQLDASLAELNAETRKALWFNSAEQRDDVEVARSLFTVALQFVDGRRARERMPRDGEDLFRDYLRTAPPPPDWKDPRALAVYVFEILRFFIARGYLTRQPQLTDEFKSRLEKTLRNFEWLDVDWLRASLLGMFDQNQPSALSLPLRAVAGRATPRQLELLRTLAGVLDDAGISRNLAAEHETAALKLLALLVAGAPGWTDDAAAKHIIQSLVMARNAVMSSSAPGNFAERLRAGDVQGAMRLLPAKELPRVIDACKFVAGLGEPAMAVVEKLCDKTAIQTLIGAVETENAGLALLLRSFLDARLHVLPCEIGYPETTRFDRSGALFLLIALRLSGESAIANGRIDEGLRLIAGLEESADFQALCQDWSKIDPVGHMRLQKALLQVMAGQRLLQPSFMHVFKASLPDGRSALVAGDASANLWPLGHVIKTNKEARATVRNWEAAWKEATGIHPRVIANEVVSKLIHARNNSKASADDREVRATHSAGDQALHSALVDLSHAQTGKPELDLTLTIVSCLLLRMWAHWLHGFSSSSVSFLLEKFIRRRGRIQAGPDSLLVELDPGPMDTVMEMAGYLSELERVPWLPGRRLKILVRGG